MLNNRVLDRLRADQLALGVLLRQARTIDIVKAMKVCDFDWLFIDMEHGSLSTDSAAQLCVAALQCDIAPIVRVPIMDTRTASKMLDNGALGIIMPRVETAEQARVIASDLRYAPGGHRSVIGTLPHFDFRPPPLAEATRLMDEVTLLIVIIETPDAVRNVEEIAAVPGIDILLIGSNDLTLEMGIHGQFKHPDFDASVRKVLGAAQRHRKYVGLGGIADQVVMADYVRQGVRFIPTLADIQYLMQAASERTGSLRKLLPSSASAS
jgi:2-keto-3-deoxy-L-rhamnonate aldolase RhmA